VTRNNTLTTGSSEIVDAATDNQFQPMHIPGLAGEIK
jgi:hypothetical protein